MTVSLRRARRSNKSGRILLKAGVLSLAIDFSKPDFSEGEGLSCLARRFDAAADALRKKARAYSMEDVGARRIRAVACICRTAAFAITRYIDNPE